MIIIFKNDIYNNIFIYKDGSWSMRGCTTISNQDEDVVRCRCDHLTHFGYLFVSELFTKLQKHDNFIIIVVGC